MPNRTKGQVEADISRAMTKFEKEHLGRGPKNVRTFIIDDMILIRLIGVLTPAEQKLATEVDGAQIVKQTRRRLIESSRSIIENIIADTTGAKVLTLHTDISAKTGERIFVLGLDKNLENKFKI